ncbi:MAG: GMC family oxidoreductase [Candidatus Binatia bacterium]
MAESLNADVVIVGAGAVGGMVAYKLATAGVKTLLLEAGPRIDRNAALSRFWESKHKGPNSPYENTPYAPHPEVDHFDRYFINEGPDQFIGTYLRGVGGTTWHFTGFATRLRPSDLRMRTQFGIGADWPLSYEELEPWWEETEKEWGVAGFQGVDHGAPRRTPYPMPGVPMTYMDKKVAEAVKPLGMTVETFPHARNSVPFDGRPPCCGSSSCVPICPIQAKYDGSVHVTKAERAGVQLLEQAVAYHIDVDSDRKISAIRFKRPDGSEGIARGKIFIIAAHAIETPKLLLMSRSEQTPNGVANASDQVGRNLMSQASLDTRALTADPIYPYRGPITTAGIVELRDGEFRARHAAIGTSMLNRGWELAIGPLELSKQLAAKGLRGEPLKEELNRQLSRQLYLDTAAEMLPDPENRIVPDFAQRDALGLPRPRIRIKVDDYTKAGLEIARQRHAAICEALRCTDVYTEPISGSVAIIAGTTKMGTDPKTSVVDANMRCHDHPNLFLMGLGCFPTAPINPPTLTAVAMAIRSVQQITADLKG